MTITLRRVGSAAVATVLIPLALVAGGGAAHATTATPPYEPDASSVGSLSFFDSTGTQIYSGSTTSGPIAAYVEGSVAPRAGDTKATLYGYLPVSGEAPGEWSGEALGASTAYPNSAAPGSLATATLPVETGSASDHSVGDLVTAFPNTATGSYAGLYQIRLVTSGTGESASTTYDSADISVSGSTWNVVYPAPPGGTPTATNTSLKESPTGTVGYDTVVTYTATVTPTTAAGTVKFSSGGTTLKSVTVSDGKATYETEYKTDGSHSVTAAFVPASSDYSASSSSAVTVTVKAKETSTKLSSSTKKVEKGHKVKLTAKESPSTSGKITFKDGSKTLKTVAVKNGSATYSTTKLPVGTAKLTAKFVPSNAAAYTSSTSAIVKVKVTK